MKAKRAARKEPMDEAEAKAAERVMLDIISSVPGYTPPSQARSRETTYAIVLAAAALLKERSYVDIRMQDVAERAGCAVPAIYARFVDKNALLNAVHLLLLQECRPFYDRELTVEKLKGQGLEGVARVFVELNDWFVTENANFMRAAILVENSDSYRATADVMDAYALRLSTVAAPLMGVEVEEIVASVRLAIHVCLGIYRDSVLGADYFPRPSSEFMRQMFMTIVEKRLTQ